MSFTYPKIATPTTALVVVDLGHDRLDGQVAACVLQGIVNRDSSEKIYVKNTYCADNKGHVQMGQRWLDAGIFADLPVTALPLPAGVANPGLQALLARYRDRVAGVIIYDPALESATIEAATTIAGQCDGLVVSPAIAEELAAYHLPVLLDLREERFTDNLACLRWLRERYFATANLAVAFTWSHMTTGPESWGAANKDYVVAHRLFTFYLDIADAQERAHYAEVLTAYPPGTPVMGWADERYADVLFGELGYFMVPYISVENLTVMSSFPSVSGAQPPSRAYPVDADSVVIAFVIADGDNLEHALVYEPHTIMTSAHLGAVPTTWVVNPGLVDLAPRAFTWYQRTLPADQELIGMMSDGSPLSDRYTGFTRYCAMARHYLAQAGFTGMKQMAEGEVVAAQVQPDVLNSGYAGSDPRGLGPYEYHLVGETFHIGSVVPGLGEEFGNVEHLRALIRHSPPGEPLFLAVFSGTASVDSPQAIAGFAQALQAQPDGRTYLFLRLRDLAATYRAWKAGA